MTPGERANALIMSERFIDYARHIDACGMEGLIAEAIRAAVEAERKASPASAWTREPPKVPGHWWLRCDERLTQVVIVYPIGKLLYIDTSGRSPVHVEAANQFWRNAEWYGPIQEPPK